METANQTANQAAAPAAPAIDLSPFCDPDASRFAIGKPWTKDGKRYATDGRVAVRIDVPGQPDDMPKGRVPNVDEIMKPVDRRPEEWLPWPAVEPCAMCSATQKIECMNCMGDGVCERCNCCGASHQCGKCEGTGKICCDKCKELGSFTTLFGKAELALWMAYEISRLPSVAYLPGEKAGTVRFKFDGGEGIAVSLSD